MMLRNLSKAKRGKREQRVRGLEGWKKRRVQGFGKERVQGVKDSRGQVEKDRRQKTEDRRQEMIVIHSNSWLFIGRREGDKILTSDF